MNAFRSQGLKLCKILHNELQPIKVYIFENLKLGN